MVSIKALLRVPLICFIAGIATNLSVIYLLGRLAIVYLPDGSITASLPRQFLLYAAIFILSLFIGGRFVRGMTRKQALLSAGIIAAYGLVLVFVQWAFDLTTGPAALAIMRLNMPFEWCSVISLALFHAIGGEAGAYLGGAASAMAPLLFALFANNRQGSAA